MGILLKAHDANFSNYIAVAEYPIISALKNLYYIRGSADLSVVDHSGNNNRGSVIGSPVFSEKYGAFSGNAASCAIAMPNAMGVNTNITAIVVYKATRDRIILGEFSPVTQVAPDGKGFAFCARSVYYTQSGAGAIYNEAFTVPTNDKFNIVVFRLANNIEVFRFTGGELVRVLNKSYSGNVILNDTANRTIYLGGNYYNIGSASTVDIAMASYYEGSITDQEIINACTFIKTYTDIMNLEVN